MLYKKVSKLKCPILDNRAHPNQGVYFSNNNINFIGFSGLQ